jgi:hypothetical protein
MIDASVARRMVGIFVVSVFCAVFVAAPALARGGAIQATDPSANSPAGTVYSIPLDSARQDAAPHGHNGGSSGSGSGTGSGGNGGSGGAGGIGGGSGGGGPGAGGGATPSSYVGSKAPVLVPGGQPGSLVHSANGFGSSSSVPSLARPASAGLGSVQNDASSAPLLAFLLAAVLVLLGGYIGVRSWTAARRPGSGPGSLAPPPSDA